jgi:hypothetical protein
MNRYSDTLECLKRRKIPLPHSRQLHVASAFNSGAAALLALSSNLIIAMIFALLFITS